VVRARLRRRRHDLDRRNVTQNHKIHLFVIAILIVIRIRIYLSGVSASQCDINSIHIHIAIKQLQNLRTYMASTLGSRVILSLANSILLSATFCNIP